MAVSQYFAERLDTDKARGPHPEWEMQNAKCKLQNGFVRAVFGFSDTPTGKSRSADWKSAIQSRQGREKSALRAVSFGLMIVALGWLCGCERKEAGGFESTLFERVEVIGKRGTGVGEFNKPRSLAVDREDNLYVVDLTGRVQKFSPEGKYLLAWQMPQTDKGKPKGMCRDGEGNIVVVEPHYSRVNHHAPDGELVKQWGVHGTNDTGCANAFSFLRGATQRFCKRSAMTGRRTGSSIGPKAWMWTGRGGCLWRIRAIIASRCFQGKESGWRVTGAQAAAKGS